MSIVIVVLLSDCKIVLGHLFNDDTFDAQLVMNELIFAFRADELNRIHEDPEFSEREFTENSCFFQGCLATQLYFVRILFTNLESTTQRTIS